MSDCWWK